MGTKYPNVYVQLSGEDSNVGSIMGRVARALKNEGVPPEEINAFRIEVMESESFNAALRTVMRWVETG